MSQRTDGTGTHQSCEVVPGLASLLDKECGLLMRIAIITIVLYVKSRAVLNFVEKIAVEHLMITHRTAHPEHCWRNVDGTALTHIHTILLLDPPNKAVQVLLVTS